MYSVRFLFFPGTNRSRKKLFSANIERKNKKMNNKRKSNLYALVECAILVALSFVLSLIKMFEMPFGGSVTLLSMLPVCVAALRNTP